jgi:hypothetical protein
MSLHLDFDLDFKDTEFAKAEVLPGARRTDMNRVSPRTTK